jgi:flagellin-specific chaperone FliS
VLPGATIQGETIAELVDGALALSTTDRLELTAAQQEYVRDHTYLTKISNIIKALALVRERGLSPSAERSAT